MFCEQFLQEFHQCGPEVQITTTNHKTQVSQQLTDSLLKSVNMENFTALYASYLRFTSGTN